MSIQEETRSWRIFSPPGAAGFAGDSAEAQARARAEYLERCICALCGHPVQPGQVYSIQAGRPVSRTIAVGHLIHWDCWAADQTPVPALPPCPPGCAYCTDPFYGHDLPHTAEQRAILAGRRQLEPVGYPWLAAPTRPGLWAYNPPVALQIPGRSYPETLRVVRQLETLGVEQNGGSWTPCANLQGSWAGPLPRDPARYD